MAAEIKQDIIEPELRTIRKRLSGTKSYGKASAAATMSVGVATATVGMLTPIHLSGPLAGLAVLTAAGASAKTVIDEWLKAQREVKMSDMYFLWKAMPHEH